MNNKQIKAVFALSWQGMKNRQNLSGSAELGLKNAITHRSNVDDYGHLVYEAMQKVGRNFRVHFFYGIVFLCL